MKLVVYYLFLFLFQMRRLLGVPVGTVDGMRQAKKHGGHGKSKISLNNLQTNIEENLVRQAKIPRYMADLYHAVQKEQDQQKLFYNGNTVRSYLDQESFENEKKHQYFFNISDIHNEQLKKGELHLYKYPDQGSQRFSRLLQISIEDVYTKKTISSRVLTSRAFGWQVFPITTIVNEWIIRKHTNKGILVNIRSFYGESNVQFASKTTIRREPILVVYTHAETDHMLDSLIKETRKSVSAENVKNDTGYLKNVIRIRRHSNDNDVESAYPCRVVPLKVPLKKIGWNKSFLSPPFFQINQCEGGCSGDKQTNHAIVQKLYATVTDGRDASYPCCSPTQFKSLPAIMKEISAGTEVYKIVTLEKLMVTDCGCL